MFTFSSVNLCEAIWRTGDLCQYAMLLDMWADNMSKFTLTDAEQ